MLELLCCMDVCHKVKCEVHSVTQQMIFRSARTSYRAFDVCLSRLQQFFLLQCYFPPFPSPLFCSFIQTYFPSTNIFVLCFSSPQKKDIFLLQIFPSFSFSSAKIYFPSPNIFLLQSKNQYAIKSSVNLADLSSLNIWSSSWKITSRRLSLSNSIPFLSSLVAILEEKLKAQKVSWIWYQLEKWNCGCSTTSKGIFIFSFMDQGCSLSLQISAKREDE